MTVNSEIVPAGLTSTGARPKTNTCGSCRGPLEAGNPICPRCDADNTEWLKFQASHFHQRRGRELVVIGLAFMGFVLIVLLGLALFVLLGERVWGWPTGLVLLFASFPFAAVGYVYALSERESLRQSLHMPGMTLKAQLLMYSRRSLTVLALGVLAGLAGPVALLMAPILTQYIAGLFNLSLTAPLPEIRPGTFVLMFLAVLYFYLMRVWGETLGHGVAREYALAADAIAPPLIFEQQEKYHALCKQAVLDELAAIVDPKKVKWLKLERADNAGMIVQASVPAGEAVVRKVNEFSQDHVPVEKKYDVKLDRWARLTSIALAKE